ncbi:hypothetical protein FACS1894199_05380 [Bacteroidia bacterium]|nr:hypothetical protein FACS1894199_05380 [Bacteroidia bacterium]
MLSTKTASQKGNNNYSQKEITPQLFASDPSLQAQREISSVDAFNENGITKGKFVVHPKNTTFVY